MKLREANLDKDPVPFIVLDTLSNRKEYRVHNTPDRYPTPIKTAYIKAIELCGVY